jgi:hypothetical protein
MTKRNATLARIAGTVAAAAWTMQAGAETRQVDTHEHGTTEAELAIEVTMMSRALYSPGADIVGIEHPPRSEADKAAVAIAALSQPQTRFVPDAAGCGATAATVSLHGDDDLGLGHAAEHLEFVARYSFDSAAIDAIGPGWFEAFPGSQKIAFSIVSEAVARSLVVTRGTVDLQVGGGS